MVHVLRRKMTDPTTQRQTQHASTERACLDDGGDQAAVWHGHSQCDVDVLVVGDAVAVRRARCRQPLLSAAQRCMLLDDAVRQQARQVQAVEACCSTSAWLGS